MTEVDSEDDLYRSRIWIATGDEVRSFTAGERDTSPRLSPDGSRLAFLRWREGIAQLATIEVDGGEARVLTDFPLGVFGEPEWAPSGSAVAVVGTDWREEWADLDEDERRRRPRRITRRDYRADGLGWRHDRSRFVYLVDPDGATEPRRLTSGTEDELGPVWSPDGTEIAFLSDTSPRPGFDPDIDIRVASVEDGSIRPGGPRGQWSALGYRPDGVLHGSGSLSGEFPDLAGLWRFEPETACVSAGHPRSILSLAVGSPRLRFAGSRAIVSDIDGGTAGVIAIDPEGEVTELWNERDVVTGFDLREGTLALVSSTVDSPGRVVIRKGDETTVHADFGGSVPETVEPDHFVIDGPACPLDVWVYLPPGEEKVPLLLNIHGGPASQYGWGYFDEFQVYAAAGYGVVATNPRGSGGGDREFLRAVTGEGWGTVDVEDVDAAVTAALERHPRLDANRMGVMGGSYGGFLTAWLIAHQDRWSAAIVERALLSWPSFGGTSDIGGWFGDGYLGEPGLLWDRSPLRVADRVRTPTLIIHSEQDYRCPIEQAEQYFDMLLRNDVPTELVRFPGEGHELSRKGRPRHREERFEIILEWLGRWL